MKIKSPLLFIKKDGLVEFEIKEIRGARFIVTKDFKQLIKASEYNAIIANSVTPPVVNDLPFPETLAPRKGRK